MAKRRTKEHSEAVRLRLDGWSYSQIKDKLGIGKGTLSGWLEKYPLSAGRIRELRDLNPRRIENFRNTMRLKREKHLNEIYQLMRVKIGRFSKRELLIAGIFLYWGEGTKSGRASVCVSNTDPSVLIFFLKWLNILGVPSRKVRVRLHLYTDMDQEKEMNFWSHKLLVPRTRFMRPYIKKSRLSDITYKTGFGHGTCAVLHENTGIKDRILMALKHIKISQKLV